MPHIKVRGMALEEVKSISTQLLDKMVELIEVPRDHFTLEHVKSTYILDGVEGGNQYPFVEVDWFDRGEKIMEQTAQAITEILKRFEYPDVTVYFRNLDPSHYFENGQHF